MEWNYYAIKVGGQGYTVKLNEETVVDGAIV
jgi:hypothetical protein